MLAELPDLTATFCPDASTCKHQPKIQDKAAQNELHGRVLADLHLLTWAGFADFMQRYLASAAARDCSILLSMTPKTNGAHKAPCSASVSNAPNGSNNISSSMLDFKSGVEHVRAKNSSTDCKGPLAQSQEVVEVRGCSGCTACCEDICRAVHSLKHERGKSDEITTARCNRAACFEESTSASFSSVQDFRQQMGAQADIDCTTREGRVSPEKQRSWHGNPSTQSQSCSNTCEQQRDERGAVSIQEGFRGHSCVQQVISGSDTFLFRIGVVDLDRKPISAVRKHYELDQQILRLVHAPGHEA
jgi:hypothetical protein